MKRFIIRLGKLIVIMLMICCLLALSGCGAWLEFYEPYPTYYVVPPPPPRYYYPTPQYHYRHYPPYCMRAVPPIILNDEV